MNWRVAIVEDESTVATIAKKQIEKYAAEHGLDAEILTFTDGYAALVALQDAKQSWDLVLLDYRVPGLDGEGLWRAIEVARPELLPRIVFITQLPKELKLEHEGAPAPVVPKPYRYDVLAQIVDKIRELAARAQRKS
ncbi:MAG: response regulator [Zetaproteobacteria bacterium]|nr:MAG: response regulator [Zetaproteobacteria bacterium]